MTTDAGNAPLTENGGKEKQRMSRVTAKTQHVLLKNAEALYPRHSHAELIEKGLEALMGNPQPIVYFCAQDPELQLQVAAILAEFGQQIENKAKAITRAKFSDPNDQKEARSATKGIIAVTDEIRSAIKGISEDANQIQKLVGPLSRLLPAANVLAARLRGAAALKTKDAANSESAGDVGKAKKDSEFAAQLIGEAKTVEEIVRHLTSQKSWPPRP
jgi:hypothetical protein